MKTRLYLFAGLPGTGKSTLSRELAVDLRTTHLRIDTIEQALRDLCEIEVTAEGYRLAYRIASDNLALGVSVIADSCNPIELTRREWEQVAEAQGVEFVNIEIICSDRKEHRCRVESRNSAHPELILPNWDDVASREYHAWSVPKITIDTAGLKPSESYARLCELLKQQL